MGHSTFGHTRGLREATNTEPYQETPPLKSVTDRMDIATAYEQVGPLPGGDSLCGTTHKTVKRVLPPRPASPRMRR